MSAYFTQQIFLQLIYSSLFSKNDMTPLMPIDKYLYL